MIYASFIMDSPPHLNINFLDKIYCMNDIDCSSESCDSAKELCNFEELGMMKDKHEGLFLLLLSLMES
jgi:hypothetical protein